MANVAIRKRDRLKQLFRKSGELNVPPLATPPETSTASLSQQVFTVKSNDTPKLPTATNEPSNESTENSTTPGLCFDDVGARDSSPIVPRRDFWSQALNQLTEDERNSIQNHYALPSEDTTSIIEQVIQGVQGRREACERKRWTFSLGGQRYSIREKADKTLLFLDRFKQAGDIAVNADPLHAGLPWALFRIILQTAISDRDQQCAIILGLERVTYVLNRCHVFAKYLDQPVPNAQRVSQLIETVLSKMYHRILRFLAAASGVLAKNAFERAAHAFWKPDAIISFISDCDSLERQLEGAATDYERILNRKEHQELGKILQGLTEELNILKDLNAPEGILHSTVQKLWIAEDRERKAAVLRWASRIPHEDHHLAAAEGRTKDTAEWLLNRYEYSDWNCSDVSTILWLHGIPGAGKTKLVSRVVDEFTALRTNDQGLAYFYCNQYEDDRRNAIHILRSFVKQLGIGFDGLVHRDLIKLYDEKKSSGFASAVLNAREATGLLHSLIPGFSRVTLILDALDECHEPDREKLITVFSELVESSSRLKILISSRRNTDIKRLLRNKAYVGIEAQDNEDDIQRFVRQKLSEDKLRRERLAIPLISDSLERDIVNTLFYKSQGMFQWATLQISQLLSLERETDIRAQLRKLPSNLTKTYDEILLRIGNQEGSKPIIATRTFHWILGVPTYILMEDLLYAVCQDTDVDEVLPVDIDADYILSACQNLCTMSREGYCVFSHLSIQEYLEEHAYTVWETRETVINTCLTFLLLNTSSNYARSSGIIRVASNVWYVIADALGEDLLGCQRTLQLLKRFLGSSKNPNKAYTIWLEQGLLPPTYFPSGRLMLTAALQPAYPELAACLFGLMSLLEEWIEAGELDVNLENGSGFSLLCFAIAGHHYDMVQTLLKQGADVNAGGRPLWAALTLALRGKDRRFLELLLAYGADVNHASDRHIPEIGNPSLYLRKMSSLLATAANYGDKDTKQLLLNAGAKLDLGKRYTFYPIRSHVVSDGYLDSVGTGRVRLKAVLADLLRNGVQRTMTWDAHSYIIAVILVSTLTDEELIQILSDRSAAVNECRPSRYGESPTDLLAAAKSKAGTRLSSMRLLSQRKGANVEEAALVAMCEEKRAEIIKSMVKNGADPNLPYVQLDREAETPLMAACRHASSDVTDLLLQLGTDVNQKVENSKYRTALLTAIAYVRHTQRLDNVKLLLRHGADVNAKAGSGFCLTPLSMAAFLAQVNVIKLLLEHGADINAAFHEETSLPLAAIFFSPLSFSSRAFDDTVYTLLQNGAAYGASMDARLQSKMAGMSGGVMYDEIDQRILKWEQKEKGLKKW